METKFSQIFDFQFDRAKKLTNTSYLEDLTGLLVKVASNISDESNYYWGEKYYLENHEKEPNSDFQRFVSDFQKAVKYGSCKKINIIRGRAGIGKSLFFRNGVQKIIKKSIDNNKDYIYMGVDFRNIDNDKDVEFYERWIYEKLKLNAIDGIRVLGIDLQEFDCEYDKFGKKYETPYHFLFPLKYFCERIYEIYNIPCIIVFDNIDLASVKTQNNVFSAIVNICNEFNNFMKIYDLECYRIYFAMRPETELRYKEGNIGAVINFPLPNILILSLTIIKKVLFDVANEFDRKKELPCNVTCRNVIKTDEMKTLSSFGDVATYLSEILDYYLRDIWNNNSNIIKRLGTSEEFHCNIVNYNVRTFMRFLSDTICNGGFKPLTKEFNEKSGLKYYNTFDYIEMIIRGKWNVHPGNANISGEGGNKAPIVYNIFDTSLYGNNEDKVKHFMLNIRILQYFFLRGENFKVCYEDLFQTLSNFFDKENINNAVKKLIYVRFLYSYKQGDNIIATIKYWQNVSIDEETELELSPIGRFYLEKMICEFEYLYQMSLSSLMCNLYVDELKSCWKTEKERTVLCFLKSIFEIIKENINGYSDKIISFKKLFYYIDDTQGSKPFRRMLDGFILVMNNKVQSAEKHDTINIRKLKNILHDALELRTEVTNYFISVLDK